jgi:DNA-binding NtrC family response regulator
LKPFEREQLLATVGRALENRRLKMENRAYQNGLEALASVVKSPPLGGVISGLLVIS